MGQFRQVFKHIAAIMGKRSNIEWQQFGQVDPFYGVLSWDDRQQHGLNPWTEAEFYANGALNWSEYLEHWERYGVSKTCCIEIGCGAGRITKHLSKYFITVHAVDVSEGMLVRARKDVIASNCVFHLSDGTTLPIENCSGTAVFSCDVFQHFNVIGVARNYFEEIYRVLDHNGSMMIQLPVYDWPLAPKLYQSIYWLAQIRNLARAELRRLFLGVGVGSPFMHIVRYQISWLARTLTEIGFCDVELAFFYNSGERGGKFLRPWVFARKP